MLNARIIVKTLVVTSLGIQSANMIVSVHSKGKSLIYKVNMTPFDSTDSMERLLGFRENIKYFVWKKLIHKNV